MNMYIYLYVHTYFKLTLSDLVFMKNIKSFELIKEQSNFDDDDKIEMEISQTCQTAFALVLL